MKRVFIFLLISLIIVFPTYVNAQDNWVAITGNSYAAINDEVTINFRYSFSDITSKSAKEGLYTIAFELQFDDKTLTPTGISTPSGWDSSLMKTLDNKYFVMSTVNDGTHQNRCTDGILCCGYIDFSISFLINDTKSETTTIKTNEYVAGVLPYIEDINDVKVDEARLLSGTLVQTYTITIKPKTSDEKKNVKSIVESSNTSSNSIKNKAKNNINSSEEPVSQKYNNNLKMLEIEGYDINFDKFKKMYEIEVPSTVNELVVAAATEDVNAKYVITGADNLEENHNKVLVEVTAQDGDKKIYVINVVKKETVDAKTKTPFTFDKNGLEIAKYFLIGASVFGLLVFGVIKIRDRKIEKEIDKL